MVGARGADWPHHAGKAQGVKFLLVEREVFVAPARLLATHPLALAKALLGATHAFHRQHGTHDAAHVQHLSDLVFRSSSLTLVMHRGQNLLDHLGVGFGTVLEGRGVVALGAFTHVLDIRLGPRPPDAIHFFTRVAGGLGLFQRGRIHHAPTP